MNNIPAALPQHSPQRRHQTEAELAMPPGRDVLHTNPAYPLGKGRSFRRDQHHMGAAPVKSLDQREYLFLPAPPSGGIVQKQNVHSPLPLAFLSPRRSSSSNFK